MNRGLAHGHKGRAECPQSSAAFAVESVHGRRLSSTKHARERSFFMPECAQKRFDLGQECRGKFGLVPQGFPEEFQFEPAVFTGREFGGKLSDSGRKMLECFWVAGVERRI